MPSNTPEQLLKKILVYNTGFSNIKQERVLKKYLRLGQLKNVQHILELYPHLKLFRGKVLRKKGFDFEKRLFKWFNNNPFFEGLAVRTPIQKFESQLSDIVLYFKNNTPVFLQCKTSGVALKQNSLKIDFNSRCFKTFYSNTRVFNMLKKLEPTYLVCVLVGVDECVFFNVNHLLNKTELVKEFKLINLSSTYSDNLNFVYAI